MENRQEIPHGTAAQPSFLVKLRAQTETFLVLGVGTFGMISTFTMNAAGGSKVMNISVFPRIIYTLMILAGIGMFFSKNKYAPPPEEENVPLLFLTGTVLITYLYFQAILHVGIIVSTVVYLMGLFIALSREPKRDIWQLVIACAIGTAILWTIYVPAAGIFLPDPWLF